MTFKPASWAGSFAIVACLGLACLADSPSAAQTRDSSTVFVDLGRWTIIERTQARYCELRYNGTDARGLVFTKSKGMPGRLRLNRSSGRGMVGGPVSWEFDDTAFEGQLLGRNSLAPTSDSSRIEQQFRQARTLTIREGDETIARLSLKNSSAGFRLLKQCAEQWRDGVVRMPSSPPPRIAARPAVSAPPPPVQRPPEPRVQTQPRPSTNAVRLSGPFPPNRALKPLDPGSWVRANDFRRFSQARLGSGAVRFTLLVNPQGRAEECTVNASSGSRDFDARACRTLQKRARFEPATDAAGNARSASYTSTVKLATGG